MQTDITVGQWAAEWFHTHAEGRTKPNTEGGYRNLIFHYISPGLSDVALGDLTGKPLCSRCEPSVAELQAAADKIALALNF